MNWSKTIKIDDHHKLGFDMNSMKIAMLLDDEYAMWIRTFTDSTLYDVISMRCTQFYLGMYKRAGEDHCNTTHILPPKYDIDEFTLIMLLGFEQLVQPDYYVDDQHKFKFDEEVHTLANLVIAFEESWNNLTKTIIDRYTQSVNTEVSNEND